MWKTIKVKYEKKCLKCRKTILVNEIAEYHTEKKTMRHTKCDVEIIKNVRNSGRIPTGARIKFYAG